MKYLLVLNKPLSFVFFVTKNRDMNKLRPTQCELLFRVRVLHDEDERHAYQTATATAGFMKH